jgi:transcriptional regulator with XRE-family HTH domain
MDDRRVGLVVRALRRRRGWRQLDLATKAACSQSMISLIERGHLDGVSLRLVRGVLAVLEATLLMELRWRGAALDRLLDEDHARLVGVVAERLRRAGWSVETEITYSEFGERGSFDLIALHAAASIVLVIEVKTDLPSLEATLRKLDEKGRLARTVARKRFGWQAARVARLLVLPDTRTLRRRLARHPTLVSRALPARSIEVRRWIASPSGPLSGVWFLSDTNGRSAVRRSGGPERIRRRLLPADTHQVTT